MARFAKIRQILKDDPEQPRFVQTIMGKGYRFIAPVVEQLIAESHSRSQVVIEETPAPVARPMRTWVILGTAILLVAIGLYAARIWSRADVSKLTEKDTIVLADFVNTTGDPVFGEPVWLDSRGRQTCFGPLRSGVYCLSVSVPSGLLEARRAVRRLKARSQRTFSPSQ
jgi:hypothetical protein